MHAQQYKWYYNDVEIPGATKHIYIADKVKGIYQVAINDGGDCWVRSEKVATESKNIRKGELIQTEADVISVFPNPAKGNFNVRFEDEYTGVVLVRLRDVYGKLVFEKKSQKNEYLFDETMIPPTEFSGIYMLEISYGTKVKSTKVMFEKSR